MIFCGVEIPQHIQGQAFLGPKAEAPRDYVYAARDRYDEMYDTVRAVRDKRFKYIRHYHPEKPYMLYNRYRNIHPIMQEMWRLHTAGGLCRRCGARSWSARPNSTNSVSPRPIGRNGIQFILRTAIREDL